MYIEESKIATNLHKQLKLEAWLYKDNRRNVSMQINFQQVSELELLHVELKSFIYHEVQTRTLKGIKKVRKLLSP